MNAPTRKRKRRWKWRSFEDARNFVRGLNLCSQNEWKAYSKKRKKPRTIPTHPDRTYKDEWTNWGDFLGTDNFGPNDYEFIPFQEARNFVRPLKLKSFTEWRKYSRGDFPEKGTRPENIPSHPNRTYKEDWAGWGDFLGTGNVATKEQTFLPFEKAREFARSLNLKSITEWIKYRKGELPGKGPRPKNIPSAPYSTYKKEWKNWRDFLGTGNIVPRKHVYLPFDKARDFARDLNLKSQLEWRIYSKGELPEKGKKTVNIPATPNSVYKKEWTNWGDFLGTGTVATKNRKYLPFQKAKTFATSLKLKGKKEWVLYCKGELPEKGIKPDNIPANPDKVYKVQWKNWQFWLKKGKCSIAVMAPEVAEEWHPTKNGNLTPRKVTFGVNKKVWWRCSTCGHEWESYIYNRKRGVGCPECAKLKVSRSLSTPKSIKKSLAYLKPEIAKEWHPTKNGNLKPEDIMPKSDKIIWWVCSGCHSEWKSKASARRERVGQCPSCSKRSRRAKRARKKWRPFEEVRDFARKLKLRSDKQWKAFCKEGKPEDIPVTPDRVYKDQWHGWGDFLGTKIDKKFLPFEEARSFVRTLNLKDSPEWNKYSKGELAKKGKRPGNIPSNPRRQYQDEWNSWQDWLGN